MLRFELVPSIVLAVLTTQVAILATTVYLHRGLTHRALTVRNPSALGFRTIIWITTGMRPREWAAVHRKHHAKTDEPDDPHSPLQLGFWKVQLTNAALYRASARDELTVRRYAKDIPPDALDRRLFDHAAAGLGTGITVLIAFCVAMGWGVLTGVVASIAHLVLYLGLSGAINAVGHTVGKRPHDNSATNLRSLALLTGGEGLHNNHHAAATSANFGLAGEMDPGWWLIRLLARLDQVELRHDARRLRRAA